MALPHLKINVVSCLMVVIKNDDGEKRLEYLTRGGDSVAPCLSIVAHDLLIVGSRHRRRKKSSWVFTRKMAPMCQRYSRQRPLAWFFGTALFCLHHNINTTSIQGGQLHTRKRRKERTEEEKPGRSQPRRSNLCMKKWLGALYSCNLSLEVLKWIYRTETMRR